MNRPPSEKRGRAGFTLVEVAVVLAVVGVVAVLGVPRLLDAVERSKASAAFAYLAAVRDANERHLAQQGVYAADLAKLDVSAPMPGHFARSGYASTPGTPTAPPSWTMTLTRDAASSPKGGYTIIFTQDGFGAADSTIAAHPEIVPAGVAARGAVAR